MTRNKLVVLCILDGWGHSREYQDNAIAQANLPFFSLITKNGMALLDAGGEAVGLPATQFGNSEIGHATIGTGRVLLQDLERINQSIETDSLKVNPALLSSIEYLRRTGNTCHLIGLASEGGVHSHLNHFLSCAKIISDHGVSLQNHIITDGRDVSPKSAAPAIKKFLEQNLRIATISGRFYAMDRDERFDRTEQYYLALLGLTKNQFNNPIDILNNYKSDEFIKPHTSITYQGIKKGDLIFFINFRADRMRQIASSLFDPDFNGFAIQNLELYGLSMTSYSKNLDQYLNIAFPPINIGNTLGEIISSAGLKQLRIAETEKYAHVTYFFNGGQELIYPGEDRIIIPSPKVLTYDLRPEMSAHEITSELLPLIKENKYNFICVNFANADMVGHTADLRATIKACETIDICLERIANAVVEQDGDILITADHGNAEKLFDKLTDQPYTAHTHNKVPIIHYGKNPFALNDGSLRDVAPTILALMNLNIPKEMTGNSLIKIVL